jgi:23S rRNA pseudouridine2605 synthase
VKYDGATVRHDTKRYVLVNKPKDFTIRLDDDPNKKSVYHFIQKACREMLYPVGKMDRSASGLMLYTNDSDMDKKLMHPKFKVTQLFHVVLNKSVSDEDLEKLTKGLYVDDKMFSAEEASFVTGKSHNEIGVRIQSNKSNKVKLMMGKLGYEIIILDRVEFAGLTKKDLPRGHYRHLTEREVGYLKMS